MATDFFQRQETARTNTKWLVFLFVVGLLGIVFVSVGLATLAVYGYRGWNVGSQQRYSQDPGVNRHQQQQPFPWLIPLATGTGALAVVGLGTLYKTAALRSGGGTGLAEHLGGTRLYPNATELHERRLLNVVEEMALASGTPVPPVYVLDEDAINAFAAGYSPSDAVIGVTRGTIQNLSREQLQGVIAHEFSHILNGDMRLNIRLIGILHGILILGLIGHFLLRSFIYSGGGRSRRSGDGKGGGGAIVAVLAVAVALIIIGFIGNLFGALIKAAVSRQREYLADASAVQFTRNPNGIAGALKRIGARSRGSRLKHPNAPEASHLFFAKGVAEGFTNAMATHPPLDKRILAIEPTWDGTFPEAESTGAQRNASDAAASFAGSNTAPELVPEPISAAAATDGAPSEPHHQYAVQCLAAIDPAIIEAAHEPYGARAVVYGLLLDPDNGVRQRQLAALDEVADPNVAALTKKLLPAITKTKQEARLPLIDLSLPALRSLSASQFNDFDRCIRQLTAADERIDLFEWTLGQVLMRHLRPQFTKVRAAPVRYYGLQRLSRPCSILLSTLAYAGHSTSTAKTAFAQAAAALPETQAVLLPKEECHLRNLHEALQQLREVVPKKRELLIDACAASISADQYVTVEEGELLRGIADLLDCPMPPLLAGQTIHGKPFRGTAKPTAPAV